ncbi:MAG: PadR family transcriptional regulator [Actinomycetota bacterium]
MAGPLRITIPLRRILGELMEDPAGEYYGLDLVRRTGLKPGSLYPTLARLEGYGWVTSRWEELDQHDAGRPRRRYYRLTPSGMEAVRKLLRQTQARRARRPRLRWSSPQG